MSKQKKAGSSLSFDDFSAENALTDEIPSAAATPEEEEEEEQEEEEVIEEQPKDKKKKDAVEPPKKEKKTAKAAPPEPDEEEEEEEEEEIVTEEEEEEDEPIDHEAFFAEVEKLTGQEIQVDYGKIDPLTPQGIALREKALKEVVLDSFLTEIEEKFPKVFLALKHANNGGDVAELFATTTARDYSNITIKDGDDALARQILTEYYKGKGVKNEARIAKLIETDEDSEAGIVKEAQSALEELKAEQEEQRARIAEEAEQRNREDRKRDQILLAAINEVVDSRDLGSFKIMDRADAVEFKQFVLNNIRKAPGGKYELATALDQSNLGKALQYQYFQFKNGDLSKMITQKAKTESVQRIKVRLKNDVSSKKTTALERTATGGSMRDFEV